MTALPAPSSLRQANPAWALAILAMVLGAIAALLAWGDRQWLALTLVPIAAAALYIFGLCLKRMLGEFAALRSRNAALAEQIAHETAEAQKARDAAEASSRAKLAFIANISHEIRTPLNALLGMAQLLERSELDRAQKTHVKVLLDAGRGLKTLLDDVIALSHDEGSDGADPADCDAAQALRTVARLLQPRAWEKQLRLTVTAAAGLPQAAADARRVRRILLKLADNALKFTERGGIELRAELAGCGERPLLKFLVVDTGLGIPPEFALNVFEPFSMADASYAKRHDGAGLGLAAAKRMVESQGGEIGFESAAGAGTTFWFTVPVTAIVSGERPEPVAIAAGAPPPKGLSILAALRDQALQAQVSGLLEPFGNKFVFADSPVEAIGLAGRDAFDIIIAEANDADGLAAAPSVAAPLLALLMPGARMPEAAAQVIRWPASAGELYAVVNELAGGVGAVAPAAASEDAELPAIDADAFAALEKSLGLVTLIEILQSYLGTATQLTEALSEASVGDNWQDAMRIAQDIAGAAGGLGLSALTAAARGFAQKARDGQNPHDLRNAAQLITGEHFRVRKALANLYPDLAA